MIMMMIRGRMPSIPPPLLLLLLCTPAAAAAVAQNPAAGTAAAVLLLLTIMVLLLPENAVALISVTKSGCTLLSLPLLLLLLLLRKIPREASGYDPARRGSQRCAYNSSAPALTMPGDGPLSLLLLGLLLHLRRWLV